MDIYNDDYLLGVGTSNGTLPDSVEKERQIGRAQRATFAAAVKAGVPMIFGTDAGVYPHGDNARQFAKMVQFGMRPMQAIQTATSSAARALDREADVGAIAVGRYGDIIAVAGNPLSDVRTLETVAFVMKGGEVVKGRGREGGPIRRVNSISALSRRCRPNPPRRLRACPRRRPSLRRHRDRGVVPGGEVIVHVGEFGRVQRDL